MVASDVFLLLREKKISLYAWGGEWRWGCGEGGTLEGEGSSPLPHPHGYSEPREGAFSCLVCYDHIRGSARALHHLVPPGCHLPTDTSSLVGLSVISSNFGNSVFGVLYSSYWFVRIKNPLSLSVIGDRYWSFVSEIGCKYLQLWFAF